MIVVIVITIIVVIIIVITPIYTRDCSLQAHGDEKHVGLSTTKTLGAASTLPLVHPSLSLSLLLLASSFVRSTRKLQVVHALLTENSAAGGTCSSQKTTGMQLQLCSASWHVPLMQQSYAMPATSETDKTSRQILPSINYIA